MCERGSAAGISDVTTKKNKELLRIIGRRLRETPELSTVQAASHDIERQLELLRTIEAQSEAHRQGCAADAGEPSVREPMPAGSSAND
jgi:hypothetical protein